MSKNFKTFESPLRIREKSQKSISIFSEQKFYETSRAFTKFHTYSDINNQFHQKDRYFKQKFLKLKYSKYFFISRKYKKIYIVKSSAQRTKTPHFSQNPFILAQQRDFGTKKISKSYHSYSLEKKETTINPNKINEESPLLAKLCSDVFTQNILFQNHEDIIKLKKFLKHIDDDLLINYHNISRKTLANLKENPIQYWIYMIVREFEKKKYYEHLQVENDVTDLIFQQIFKEFSEKITILIKKINDTDGFLAQTLEHFFKFFVLLIDRNLQFFQAKITKNYQNEKNQFALEINSLKETIKSYEDALFDEKANYEKEYTKFRQKFIENQDTISTLSKELDEVSKVLADSKNVEKAEFTINNLFDSANSFSNYLNKIGEENNDKFIRATNSMRSLIKLTVDNKPLIPGSINNLKKKTDFDAIFEFGLFTEKHTLIEAITDHPFKFVLTNLKEINLGATIKKLNKEELIQMIEKFFNKMIANEDRKIIKSPSFSFVEFLLENELNLIVTTIRLTETLNILNLFKNYKFVNILSKIFGIFNQKPISKDCFMYLLIFLRNFQETQEELDKRIIDFDDEIKIKFVTIKEILMKIQIDKKECFLNEINEKFENYKINYRSSKRESVISNDLFKNHSENVLPFLSIFQATSTIIEAFEKMTFFFENLDENKTHFISLDKLKNAFSTNFSLNIENEIFHENLKMFIVNNDHFNYIEFLNQQRDKLYDGSNNENSIHLNEALFLFITYFMEIENAKNTIQIQNFMEKIIKENAFFSYPIFKEKFCAWNYENKEEFLTNYCLQIYSALFSFNQNFQNFFQILKKSKMNFNDLNFHIKKEEIKERFEEILNFYKNNYVFMSKSNFFDENKSINDSPSKKGLSRTLFKRPATISVFKVAEKKPRNSFNKNSEGN